LAKWPCAAIGRIVTNVKRLAGVLAVASLLAVVLAAVALSNSATPNTLPPLALQQTPGWMTVTTGPTNPRKQAPQVWAITTRGDEAALRPFDLFDGLRSLSRNGIVVWASTAGRGGPTKVFTGSSWPLRLLIFRVDTSWEGQPAANIQQRLRWASVDGWHVDGRVYFGTQRPSKALLARAQAELNRLRLP